jgi:lipopolysaccharide heptosyltransferase I
MDVAGPADAAGQRFLLVRLGALGDVVHGIPAAAALRRAFPEARIDWLINQRYVELLLLVDGIDHAIAFDTRPSPGQVAATISALRAARYDAVLDIQGLLKSAALARAAGARRTVGFTAAHLREPAARFLYTETVDPGDAVHVIDKNLALLPSLGVTDLARAFPLAARRTAVSARLEQELDGRSFVLVNPGAAWPNKRWPAERFGALAAALRDRAGLHTLVLWGPGEEPLAEAVVAASRGAAQRLPGTTIVDLFAIARAARLMVSGDTGPLHIAGAAGTPLVALFGPTRAERNGPWDPADVVVSRTAGCECLYERRCRRASPCVEDITAGEVIAAVERRLSAASSEERRTE